MIVLACLSRCKTTPTLEESHLLYYLERSHPVTICVSRVESLVSTSRSLITSSPAVSLPTQTDDTLPFRTSLMAEYALLLADAPLGLAMKEQDVGRIAAWGVEGRFEAW